MRRDISRYAVVECSTKGNTMTERCHLLLRAVEALRRARRMKPGPERNELRQVAKTLRALARLDDAAAADTRRAPMRPSSSRSASIDSCSPLTSHCQTSAAKRDA